ncbi:nucleoside triphosphate pyrophosphohydrolase [Bacillus sp. FJAT-50079]|uniref:nucleoside triphosphate pyrophosphohydrolase n=1 Tax=Bacillus sp. FJAT-50079 TaxID=2833577 RepID=UPI001BC8FFC5|nr:nucleoside triphosphate pyrophosphohydrolase [Bacillus sp. FJAT-50079]MBS4210809.1 nucleoside triphosphate pyrophosphohydrolase [Bacillus sp. FJAT-50079]
MNELLIIGLGAGQLDQMPLGVYKQLKNTGRPLFLRTKEHPVVEELIDEQIAFSSFDEIYEKHDQFAAVYEEIAETLLERAAESDLIYAVPGHPLVAERTVQLLMERGAARGIDVKIGGGQSFLDSLFTAVKVDPVDGFQLLDGTMLRKEDIMIHQHIIISQVFDAFIASDVKLTLMDKYPDDYPVTIVTAAGSEWEEVKEIPLFELDRQVELSNLTSLYVPPIPSREYAYKEFSTLREIIAELRGPKGCPWDKKQTHQSLKKYLIEESYELLEAIDHDDIDDMTEELGDVLLQVLLHAQIGEDDGMFSIEDVIESISEKMIRRHPHVFGNAKADSPAEVKENWEKIKAAEKGANKEKVTLLATVGKGLPALLKAYEYQKEAGKVGFDWDQPGPAIEKVREELQEFELELANDNQQEQLNELGDLLFAVINVSRLAGIHPEEALQTANDKFSKRFSYVEMKVLESGKPFEEFDLVQLDQFWNEAKTREVRSVSDGDNEIR